MNRAQESQESETDQASTWLRPAAFLLPLLIAGAYLNMGQSSCGDQTLKCQNTPVTHTIDAEDGSTQTTTDGDDVILVIAGPVTVHAGAGNDTVCVLSQRDNIKIYGGPGNDTILGGPGSSLLLGEEGTDIINGGDGIDYITGGPGNDLLVGGGGDDWLDGQDGDDTLSGDDGDDVLLGGTGEDVLSGGPGDDILWSESERGDLRGGPGSDTAYLCGPTSYVEIESVCNDYRCPGTPYLPEGRRRSCSTLSLTLSDGTYVDVPIPNATTLTVPISYLSGGRPEIDRVTLRGDRSNLVELFNLSLFDADSDNFSNVGTNFDPFFFFSIQVRYPYERSDSRHYSIDLDAARDQLGLTYFGPATLARVYDLGECSFGASWDDIASGVREELEPLTDQIAGLSSLIEWVRLDDFYIRPILTNDETDRIYVDVTLKLKADISCCNTAKVHMGMVLKPTTSTTLPLDLIVESYNVGVYDVNGVILRLLDGWLFDLNDIVNQYASEYIPASLGQYFIDSLPITIPSFVRARRVVMTSGSLEAVLAEDIDDVQYQGILAAGLGNLVCPSAPAPALQGLNWWRYHGLP